MNNRQMKKRTPLGSRDFKLVENVFCISPGGRQYTLLPFDHDCKQKNKLARVFYTFNRTHNDKFMLIKFKDSNGYGMLCHGDTFIGKVDHENGEILATVSYSLNDGTDRYWFHAINLDHGNTAKAICGGDSQYTEDEVKDAVLDKEQDMWLR